MQRVYKFFYLTIEKVKTFNIKLKHSISCRNVHFCPSNKKFEDFEAILPLQPMVQHIQTQKAHVTDTTYANSCERGLWGKGGIQDGATYRQAETHPFEFQIFKMSV